MSSSDGPADITLSVSIENTYEDGETVLTTATDVTMPAPSTDPDQVDDWAYDHLFPLTGTGRTDGDSWYTVTITASTDPALLGREFDFGY